ncbi:bromodomain-containing protein 4 isoform X2 [Conger conger]|uniref:bromodomain-containing protein 4 isoform X2 n=1 Tax=Conger conger TaxID=82655 RepID=UPI002A5ADB9B|nr:bromodomain-containing protein 4 isoform X2 [Conger conger]
MGENKMEPLGEDTTQVESKQPEENEGGILRRLRDRSLLRKRRAEAEEKAIYQVQSKRKRSEGMSGAGRKGRPKKSEAGVQPQLAQEGALQGGSTVEEQLQGGSLPQPEEHLTQDPAKEEEPVASDTGKPEEPVEVESLPPPALPPALTQTLMPPLPPPAPPAPPAPEPQPEIVLAPVQEQAPLAETSSSLPKEEVAIEDLGADDVEVEPPPSGELVMEQGRTDGVCNTTCSSAGRAEEPGDIVTDSTRVFSISTIVSPPSPSYLPGPSL